MMLMPSTTTLRGSSTILGSQLRPPAYRSLPVTAPPVRICNVSGAGPPTITRSEAAEITFVATASPDWAHVAKPNAVVAAPSVWAVDLTRLSTLLRPGLPCGPCW